LPFPFYDSAAGSRALAGSQIGALNDPKHVPGKGALNITDDEIRETLEAWQLRLQRERGNDLVLFSPGAGRLAHHIGDATTSLHWSRQCNDLIHRARSLSPTTSPASVNCRSHGALLRRIALKSWNAASCTSASSGAISIPIRVAAIGKIRR
jgi:hypothetical protein